MGYAGVHRGGKHGMYEGGVRVPRIVRWPARVPASRVDDKSALSGVNCLPALCAITCISPPTPELDVASTPPALDTAGAFAADPLIPPLRVEEGRISAPPPHALSALKNDDPLREALHV